MWQETFKIERCCQNILCQVRVIAVFPVVRLLTDFVCLLTNKFGWVGGCRYVFCVQYCLCFLIVNSCLLQYSLFYVTFIQHLKY
jgi:hypothetical protein